MLQVYRYAVSKTSKSVGQVSDKAPGIEPYARLAAGCNPRRPRTGRSPRSRSSQQAESDTFVLSMSGLRRAAADWTTLPGFPPSGCPLRGGLAFWQFCAGLALLPAHAQQAPAQPAEPEARQAPPEAKPAQADAQQPGAGAQVHTGTSSGLEADDGCRTCWPTTSSSCWSRNWTNCRRNRPSSTGGILANRSNDLNNPSSCWSRWWTRWPPAATSAQEKLLRKALAEDYLRSGDWAKAAKAYQTLDARLQGQLSPDEQDEIEMPLKLLPLAADNPPMTVEPCDPFMLQVSQDPLGLTDIPVFVDARPHSLDAGPHRALQPDLAFAGQRGGPQGLRASPPPSTPSPAGPSRCTSP